VTVADLGGVVFDLDGTLIDSREDLATAVNRVREELGLAPLPVAEVVGMVGQGARNLVRRALGGAPDEALLDRALALFLERYEPICTSRTRPYPGIPELLAGLASVLPLAILTNKPERPTRKIVAHFGWSGLFRVVLGGDSLGARKPEPQGLLEIARRLEVAPADLVLIGDSAIDAATAEAAGARFLFVEWGFARPEERAGLGAAPRAGSAGELRDLLEVPPAPPQ